ncbi:prepilin-type N-terminal cleavage/methylation domain-containing protein [Lysinibacillus pakistanensis]|uniref:type II secretion system protein n=1 Tax=Lysinibacillus pakistanensis TaxID=759811 RepID=UPI003D2DBCDF
MFKKLMNKKLLKNQKGLTLIELLAVIVILAIVAAIAVPAIGNIIENSRYNAVKADAINVISAANLYYTDNPEATTNVKVSDLKDNGYLDNPGKIPLSSTVSSTPPRGLSTPAGSPVEYSNTKTITFTNASIEWIGKDSHKGSKIKGMTITSTGSTPTP